MEQGCWKRTQNQISPALTALTLALWFWNHTWTTRTLSPVSAASVSLTWKHPGKRFSATPKKTKHFTQHHEILCLLNIAATFPNRHIASWFALISVNVEWMQRSFWTLLVIASSKPWTGRSACFRAWAMEAVLLSQYDIWCRRTALHQPASVNTEQNAACHFKAQLWGGKDFFNLRILFVKLL